MSKQRPISVNLSGVLGVKRTEPLHVLIAEPQLVSYGSHYLPVMWGVLKTYWEQHTEKPELANWHEPIYQMRQPEELVAPFRDQQLDIIGLSCYTWNWRLQQRLATLFRASHPDALIIAGGPHPDYRDPEFFVENQAIDAVVVRDGEVPFTRILERTLAYKDLRSLRSAGRVLDDIPGLCLPDLQGQLTAPAVVPEDYKVSAYLAQRDYYERFFKQHPEGVCVAWETSRGCPFRCSYCDWGSSTMSKVRRFDMDRLKREIDWFGENKTASLFSVDSNFGMFKTDLDLTERIVETKNTYGYPQYFVYSNAKNVPDRTVDITRMVTRSGLDTAHTLSIQHTNEEVLEATDRKNISVEKQIRVVRSLQADSIPISVQLIIGLPRDTPELWRRSFTDLMEWGIHDGYIITNYHLLPNAPAAQPEYRQKWGIIGVDRYIYDGIGVQENEPIDPLTYARGEVIVETSTFSRSDWVTMSTEGSIIRGLHNPGVTQNIAKFLHHSLGVAYETFYEGILDTLFQKSSQLRAVHRTLHDCYTNFLIDDQSRALLPMPGRDDDRYLVEPHRWLFATICMLRDVFFDELSDHLSDRFGHDEIIRSLCTYQRDILAHPSYDSRIGKQTDCKHDWVRYFREIESGTTNPGLPSTSDGVLQITDTGWDDRSGRSRYDWAAGDSCESWTKWFHCIATGRLSPMKSNHQNLALRARDQEHPQTELRIRA
jgi:putative methyltransferase